MPRANVSGPVPASPPTPPERIVRFRLRDRAYGIAMARISGLAPVGRIRAVPGAPPGVRGLVEWRGRLLTVLDLVALVGDGPGDGPGCLVRLAEPYAATALLVPATVHLERTRGLARRDVPDPSLPFAAEATLVLREERFTLIDPVRFVRALERALDQRARG